jgi:hypothetical protein
MRRSPLIDIGIASIAASVLLVSAAATAAPGYSGTISGSFGAPVLAGAFLQAGSHAPILQDNSGAPCLVVGTGTIAWGGTDSGCGALSHLTFNGDVFSDVTPGQVFRLGTLSFVNGPSTPAALIFGFDMQLSAGEDVAPFTGFVEIVSTQNANVDPTADADVLSFADFDVPSTLAAFELATVTAIVNGTIGDDGRLRVTSIALAPDEGEQGCAEDVAAVLHESVRGATASLGVGATAVTKRKARRAVRLTMRQLRSYATSADRAAKRGEVSEACAEAIRVAVANAETQASPLLRPDSR